MNESKTELSSEDEPVTEISSTSPETTPQEHPERPPLSGFLWFLMGFLVIDAGIRIFLVLGGGSVGRPNAVLEQRFLHLVTASFALLIILQLVLRSTSARIWGTVFFLVQIFYFTALYGVRHPEYWLALTSFERTQEILRVFCFTLGAVFMQSRAVKECLFRP